MQGLLNKDLTQTQQQLVEALSVSQKIISRRLRAMGKINKFVRWGLQNLGER